MSALFVKKITTLDFSYFDPVRGVVGETWIVDVTLYGALNEEGMVFDFKDVKQVLKASIDAFADHKLLIPAQHRAFTIKQEEKRVDVLMLSEQGLRYRCVLPSQAVVLLPIQTISLAEITPLLQQHLCHQLPENVNDISITLYPEVIDGAYYHYSHGLKKHAGDCQRIAHGHRSRIEIFLNHERAIQEEACWAKMWEDIYIATQEDLVTYDEKTEHAYAVFDYQATQGRFRIELPEHVCYVLETDTTVELLCAHVAEALQVLHPTKYIKVCLYEGVDKGAVVEKKPLNY